MTTNEKSRNVNDQAIHLYSPPIIASLLAALLRNAADASTKFDSFEDQLDATCALAADILRRRPGSQSAENFVSAANFVREAHGDPETQELFTAAHIAIMHLINKLASREGWEPCGFIPHHRIEQIVGL